MEAKGGIVEVLQIGLELMYVVCIVRIGVCSVVVGHLASFGTAPVKRQW